MLAVYFDLSIKPGVYYLHIRLRI